VGELCASGACGGGLSVDCTAYDDQCNMGVCDPDDGSCYAEPANEGDPCINGDLCTASGATCDSGACVGGTPVDCSAYDGECAEGVCDPDDGSCYTVLAETCPLNSLCGSPTGGTYCGGNCTYNTAEFADAYCQIGGYAAAESYTEQTSGMWGPTWYYDEWAHYVGWLPTLCSDLGWSTYGAASYCTCLTSLVCTM